MNIQIFNTLSREKEIFKPLRAGEVSMYNCGPTVYDTPHIGNYRTFVMGDILRRVFEYNGYKVTQVMNVTDVDDKTMKRSRAEGIPLKELTIKYEKLFLYGLTSLNIQLPHHLTRATEYIGDMVKLTEALLEKGVAYKVEDGIYLRISSINNYGALAGFKRALEARADSQIIARTQPEHSRVRNDEYDKENARDFALWKFKKPEDGDVSWPAPFGEGRPGWHIECSAMSMKLLGQTIDVHTGGQDLLFPHHTNEIAQSESATGKPFVKYWVHGAFMDVSNEKMAKSKGNFVKLEDLLEEKVSPLSFRYWLMTAHYRSPVNFTLDSVKAAQNALIKFMAAVAVYPDGGNIDQGYRERFLAFINDDMDMPKAIALAWELIKDPGVAPADKRATLLDFDRVFGLKLAEAPRFKEEPVPTEIQALADAREEARKAKDWKKADALRTEIEARGFEVDDTEKGPRITSK